MIIFVLKVSLIVQINLNIDRQIVRSKYVPRIIFVLKVILKGPPQLRWDLLNAEHQSNMMIISDQKVSLIVRTNQNTDRENALNKYVPKITFVPKVILKGLLQPK
ncbi:hypothetical protein MTP99_001514 [Tenebrio molitor]|nr:hypothetical protein MTP99_001514 [Tenebrio molitor]